MRYMNALRNQWIASRAWMFCSIVSWGISIYLVTLIVGMNGQEAVRLIPYSFATSSGPITVTADAISNKSTYLTAIATADINNYTTWKPNTVVSQTSRFVNRMAPGLYSAAGTKLINKASDRSKTEQAQSLFVSSTQVADNTVKILGILRMYQGIKQVKAVHMQYLLSYKSNNGMPMLVDFKANHVLPRGGIVTKKMGDDE